ncbi:MAG: hypothetical protein WAN99_01905 [Methanoculleus sp.]
MLVLRILKDPYVFGIGEDAVEREPKRALLDHIRKTPAGARGFVFPHRGRWAVTIQPDRIFAAPGPG